MKVILLNSCAVSKTVDPLQRSWLAIHIGVASIAGYLRSLGCEVSIVDSRLDKLDAEGVVERILAENPAYVGFSAITEEIHDAGGVAAEVKKRNPSIINVLGGCHASALPVETLREFSGFDIVVSGEGEKPFGAIVQGVPLNEIPGVAYRASEGEPCLVPGHMEYADLDKLPPPAWDLFQVSRYLPPMQVELLRACPYGCTFCFQAIGKKVRYKSPKRVLEDIEQCVNVYGVRHLYLSTNGTWPLAREHCEEICNGIIERDLKICWCTSARVDRVDAPILSLMHKSGCNFIDFGIETGNSKLLDQIRKETSQEQIVDTVKLCHKIGIDTELNFVIGLPNETNETLQETFQLVRKLRHWSTIANFALLIPFPGSEVYNLASRNEEGMHILSTDWRRYTKQSGGVLAFDNLTREELIRWRSKFYRYYYLQSPLKVLQLLRSPNAREMFTVSRFFGLLKSLVS